MPTYTIRPGPGDGQDTYVVSSNPNNNYGTQTGMAAGDIGPANPGLMRALIRMPIQISLEPHEAIRVTNVPVLQLSLSTVTSPRPTLDIHPILSEWGHTTVTWNSQPSFGPPVGSFTPQTNPTDVQLPPSLIEMWVNEVNYGMMIKHPQESGAAALYATFTTSRGATSDRPILTFDYEIVMRPKKERRGTRGYNAPIIGRRGRGIFTF